MLTNGTEVRFVHVNTDGASFVGRTNGTSNETRLAWVFGCVFDTRLFSKLSSDFVYAIDL